MGGRVDFREIANGFGIIKKTIRQGKLNSAPNSLTAFPFALLKHRSYFFIPFHEESLGPAVDGRIVLPGFKDVCYPTSNFVEDRPQTGIF